ncbi:MAG: tetratricopeptide repeat protein [Candidatus Heimdallarchaeota archaeon]|nr:tetratricopeptide repeat protein [Candidatus Heimdallarchaeota archaeon]
MSQEAEKLVEEGIEFYKKGAKDKAFTNFNKTIELDPNNAKAFGNRGRIYFEQNKFGKALSDLNKAIELDNKNYLFHHNLANVYFSTQKFDKAIESYEQSIELNPENAWGYENIGVVYYQRQEMDKALEYFEKALQYEKSEAQFFHNRGGALMYLKKYKEALSDFEDALKLNDQNSWAHANIAIIYSEQEKLADAILHLNSAIELDPSNNVFYKTRSDIYIKMGKFDDAKLDYEQAKKLGYNYPKTGFFHKKILSPIKSSFKNYWLTLSFVFAYILTFIVVYSVNGGYATLSAQSNAAVVDSGVWHIFTGVFYTYGSSFLDDVSWLSSISGLQVYSGIIVLFTFLWCLFVYGRRMERTFPKWIFPVAYLGFGFLGNAMFYLLSPNQTFCISNLSAIWGLAGWIFVDTLIRMKGKGEGFEAIGTFLEFLDGNVNFFVGIVMVSVSSALSQNGWHFFIGTGITFIIGITIGIITGIRAVRKAKKLVKNKSI